MAIRGEGGRPPFENPPPEESASPRWQLTPEERRRQRARILQAGLPCSLRTSSWAQGDSGCYLELLPGAAWEHFCAPATAEYAREISLPYHITLCSTWRQAWASRARRRAFRRLRLRWSGVTVRLPVEALPLYTGVAVLSSCRPLCRDPDAWLLRRRGSHRRGLGGRRRSVSMGG
jgi:hypothetical protein